VARKEESVQGKDKEKLFRTLTTYERRGRVREVAQKISRKKLGEKGADDIKSHINFARTPIEVKEGRARLLWSIRVPHDKRKQKFLGSKAFNLNY